MSRRIPSYRLHRPTGQAVATIDGHDHYLGRHSTPESRSAYDRMIAEWLAGGRSFPVPTPGDPKSGPALTVAEVILAYLKHCHTYYRVGDRLSKEVENIRLSLRPLRKLYGPTPAAEFGPLALKKVRQAMIGAGLCRNQINFRIGRVVRLFKWATENEMVPKDLHHGLKAVAGLAKGRSDARETPPVRPADDAVVDAVEHHVARQVWAMIGLQRLTGMRPGEACIMRTMDIDRSGDVWIYRPESHKTAHHGKERPIFLGPRAQAILAPWLRADQATYLFSPAEAVAERKEKRRAARKTKVQPSQVDRSKAGPGRRAGDRYTTKTYHHAIKYGCRRAFPHPTLSKVRKKDLTHEQKRELLGWNRAHAFHPHQLRHSAGTLIRKAFDLDTSRAVMGHTTPDTAAIYAEQDYEKATDAMRRVG